jgi:hypothetical protein
MTTEGDENLGMEAQLAAIGGGIWWKMKKKKK